MAQHSFCKHSAPVVETRRMIPSCENRTLGQGHDLTGKGDVAYQSIRIISLNTSNTSKMFCIALACLSKVLVSSNGVFEHYGNKSN